MNKKYDSYMDIAIDLAEKGRGRTSPNPLVGAVIVRDGQIVGKGFHQKVGNAHAEVNAINNAGERSIGATLICTLEPCAHFGRTPPCTSKIIKSGIKNVILGTLDPNPLVNGKGAEALKKAGISVTAGVREEKIKRQNEEYLKFIKTGLPFVTLKVAVSADGKISKSRFEKTGITGKEAGEFVHGLRSRSGALITGIGTVLADDPLLNVRLVGGQNPIRVILDSSANIPMESNIVKTANTIRTLVFTTKKAGFPEISKLKQAGIVVKFVEAALDGIDIKDVLSSLAKMGVSGVMVEAGARLSASFLKQGLIDKLVIIEGMIKLGSGAVDAFEGLGWKEIKNNYLQTADCEQLGEDNLYTIRLTEEFNDQRLEQCLQA